MTASPFATFTSPMDGPPVGAYSVTPSDSTDLTTDCRGLTINGAGTVAYIGWDGVTYTTGTLPVGRHTFLVRRVKATGTTATGITAWI